MTLKEILEQARRNIGNNLDYIGTKYHLPEFKISEAIAAEPTMNTSTPGKTPEMINRETQGILGNVSYLQNLRGATGDTGDTGGTNGTYREPAGQDPGGNLNVGGSEEDIARARYEAARRQIESKLNAAREYAKELIGAYGKTRDDTKGTITDSYGKLKSLIGEKLNQSLESLDQSDVGVQNNYGRLAGNALRAMEGSLTKNNLLAKVFGNAGSSWYQNLQGKTRNEGVASIYDTKAEEAAKRAAIGTQKGATTSEFNQHEVEAGAEEARLLTAAEEKYNTDVANARLLERNYGIDSEAAIAEAEANFTEAQRQVDSYRASRQNAATTGQNYGDTKNTVSNYSALGNIKDVLGNNTAADRASGYASNAGSFAGVPTTAISSLNPMRSEYFLKRRQEEDPNQYFINR